MIWWFDNICGFIPFNFFIDVVVSLSVRAETITRNDILPISIIFVNIFILTRYYLFLFLILVLRELRYLPSSVSVLLDHIQRVMNADSCHLICVAGTTSRWQFLVTCKFLLAEIKRWNMAFVLFLLVKVVQMLSQLGKISLCYIISLRGILRYFIGFHLWIEPIHIPTPSLLFDKLRIHRTLSIASDNISAHFFRSLIKVNVIKTNVGFFYMFIHVPDLNLD